MSSTAAIDELEFTSHSTASSSDHSSSIPPLPRPSLTSDNHSALSSQLQKSSHPSQIILHVAFKALSLFFYIVNPSSSFVTSFTVIILLLSADFYVTKNLTGRKLAKLRWWNSLDESGNNIWTYECLDETDANISINKADVSFFWSVLYVYPLIWATFLVLGVVRFKFDWCLLCGVGTGLVAANLIGFSRCDKEKRKRWGNFVQTAEAEGGVFGGAARGAFVDAMFRKGAEGYMQASMGGGNNSL